MTYVQYFNLNITPMLTLWVTKLCEHAHKDSDADLDTLAVIQGLA